MTNVISAKKAVLNSLKISRGYTAPFTKLYSTSLEVDQDFTKQLKNFISIGGSLGFTNINFALFKLEERNLIHVNIEGYESGNVMNVESKDSTPLEKGHYVLVKRGLKSWAGSDTVRYNEVYPFKVGEETHNLNRAYICLVSC
jgi:hypothetical protein